LTTRIRINIPGSRPIPPVVVRKPVEEGADAESAAPAPAEPEAAETAEPEPEKKEASDWFAPRRPANAPPSPAPAPAPAAEPGPPPFGGSAAAPSPEPYADPFAQAFTSPPADPFTDPDTGTMPSPYAPPAASPADGGPDARGPHETPPGAFPSPFGTGDFPAGVPRPADPFTDTAAPSPEDRLSAFGGAAPTGFQPPAGPTSGPATGSMPVPPMGPPPGSGRPEAGAQPGPGRPGTGGAQPGHRRPGAPLQPGGFPPPPGEGVSGDTLVSGIPAVPPGEIRGPRPPAPAPAPAPERVPASATSSRPARKSRSKSALLGVAVGAVVVVAYGAGLLMNHGDVPKGTTVLGVDIGNMDQTAAVQMLDKALGNRATAPLTLAIGGRKQTLKPSVAGLSVDTDATVRNVAHTDYNPVSVIGSLFGGSRDADPVYLVDNDKLKAALQELAGRSSSGGGMVRFADHKAVAVPGKPGTSFDVDSAAARVAAAYRTRAETGADQPIDLRVTTVPPKVTQAELDQAVNGFGKTAMAGKATVTAGGVHQISFNNSLPQILTMVPDQTGTLQPHIDLTVLKSLYGKTFDGVLLKHSDGGISPVTPADVAAALIQALGSTTDRTVTLPNVVH
jgi:hypothetical protein